MTVNSGDMTVAELRDLLKSKDYDQGQLTTAYGDFSPAWAHQDQSAFLDWTIDWTNMKNRYAAARSKAQFYIDLSSVNPLPDNAIDAQGYYTAVLTALKQVPGTITKGDFDDLSARLQAAGGSVSYSNEPQPTPGSDLELNLLNDLPDPVKKVDQTLPAWLFPAIAVTLGVIVVSKVKEIL